MIEEILVILAMAILFVSILALREVIDVGNDLVEIKAMLLQWQHEREMIQ